MSDPQDRAEQLDDDKIATSDDPSEELEYPPDEPLAVDAYGTTPAESRWDEPLDERVDREEPEAGPAGGMRLVSPDEGAGPDDEADAVASSASGTTGADLSAEESAVNETTPPPMGDGDGYVEPDG